MAKGFNDHHTESGLSFADHEPSPIEVEMINYAMICGLQLIPVK